MFCLKLYVVINYCPFHCVIFVRLLMPLSIFSLPRCSSFLHHQFNVREGEFFFFAQFNKLKAGERQFPMRSKSIELNKRVGRMRVSVMIKIVSVCTFLLFKFHPPYFRSFLSMYFHPSNVIYHYYLFVQVNNIEGAHLAALSHNLKTSIAK